MYLRKQYQRHIWRKKAFIVWLLFLTVIFFLFSLYLGSSQMTMKESFMVLVGYGDSNMQSIVLHIRVPRIIGGLFVGVSIALSGLIVQSALNNPLASPSTIGISAASAAGANIALIVFAHFGIEASVSLTAISSFVMAMICMLLVLGISSLRMVGKTTVILAGTAFHALFMALITIIQYFADDTELASAVSWTFGDLGRIHFDGIVIVGMVTTLSALIVYFLRWHMNAMDMGERAAHSLGVNAKRMRNISIFIAALNTGVSVALVGIIGFVGLLAPQLTKRVIGEDKRFMLPATLLMGACIVLFSDCIARTLISPLTLPVGAVTSVFGAPLFLYILLKEG